MEDKKMKSYGAGEVPSLDGSFDFGLFDGRESSSPRASSYTENTSCPWSRNHWATLGPVHSSTKNRIHAVSASGMNVVPPRDCDANSKQA